MKKQLSDQEKARRRKLNKYIIGGFILFVIIFSVAASNTKTTPTSSKPPSTTSSSSSQSNAQSNTTTPPVTRQVKGTAVTLSAGTYSGGKDVVDGLYEVTTTVGQSGNFIVSGTDSYNEILGNTGAAGGVPKVRVQISDSDKIEISSLSSVTFTPVTTPFVSTHSTVNLYAGTWTVGQDIGAGRYIASPGSGQSGNFIVSGNDSYNEILGGNSAYGGVPSLTVNLTSGDTIVISSLSQVTMTPSN